MSLKEAKRIQKKMLFSQYVDCKPKKREQKLFEMILVPWILLVFLGLILGIPTFAVIDSGKYLFPFLLVFAVVSVLVIGYALVRKKIIMHKLLSISIKNSDIDRHYLWNVSDLQIFCQSPTALYLFPQEPDEELLRIIYCQFYHLNALRYGKLRVYLTDADLFNQRFCTRVPRDRTIMGIVYDDLQVTQENAYMLKTGDISKLIQAAKW